MQFGLLNAPVNPNRTHSALEYRRCDIFRSHLRDRKAQRHRRQRRQRNAKNDILGCRQREHAGERQKHCDTCPSKRRLKGRCKVEAYPSSQPNW
jgi:hypothetical protein